MLQGEFFIWRVMQNEVKNQTGAWYLTIMTTKEPLINITNKNLDRNMFRTFQSDYWLRTWTSGCYYYNEVKREWMAPGITITHATPQVTNPHKCLN